MCFVVVFSVVTGLVVLPQEQLCSKDRCGKRFSRLPGHLPIMATKMDPRAADGNQDLVRFLEDILQSTVIKMGQRCHSPQEVKPVLRLTSNSNNTPGTRNNIQDIQRKLLQVMSSSRRLEHKLDRCLWIQTILSILVMVLMVLCAIFLYILSSNGRTATF